VRRAHAAGLDGAHVDIDIEATEMEMEDEDGKSEEKCDGGKVDRASIL